MRSYRTMAWGTILIVGMIVVGQSAGIAVAQGAKLEVIPEKTALAPTLIQQPVAFKGAGFGPKEMVMVELILPPGVKVKAIPEGENVGLAVGQTDDKGEFEAKMAPTATLNWFFQVGWTPEGKPNLQEAKPLPPGKYEIVATGMSSGKVVKAAFELLKPPPAEKK